MSGPCTHWTVAEDTVLREGLLRGLSYSQIGRKVGRSRCAVSGRVDRLGIGRGVKRVEERASRPVRAISANPSSPRWDERLIEPYAVFKARKQAERARQAEVSA